MRIIFCVHRLNNFIKECLDRRLNPGIGFGSCMIRFDPCSIELIPIHSLVEPSYDIIRPSAKKGICVRN